MYEPEPCQDEVFFRGASVQTVYYMGMDEDVHVEQRCILARMAFVTAEAWALSLVRMRKDGRPFPKITVEEVAEELRRLAWRVQDYYETPDIEPLPAGRVREFAPICKNFMEVSHAFVEEEVRTIMNDMIARASKT